MFAFSFKILITNIFNSVNNFLFSVIFGRFYTKNIVGQYTQADKWNKMGSNMISGMVQGVAQPMFVQVGDDKERLRRAFRKMLRFTSLITFPAMFGLVLVAPEFIVIAVGEKWLPSAELMQMLCVAGAFMPIAVLYYNFIISRGKSGVYMWNVICQGVVFISLMCAIKWLNIHFDLSLFGLTIHLEGVRLMVITYVIIYILWMFVWHHFLKREIQLPLLTALKDLLPFALIAAVTMVATGFITHSISNIYVLLVSRILIAAVIYLTLTWLCGANILKESVRYIFNKNKEES